MESVGSFIRIHHPRPSARMRLVCFPFAGASASAYRTWGRELPEAYEVLAVQLPGREDRASEPLATRCSQLVAAMADELAPKLVTSFCFFGHSMGALLAYRLAQELRRRGARGPARLFMSARVAPHLPQRPPLHALPERELIAEIRRFNGTPEALLAEPDIMALFLPILRADFAVNEAEPYEGEAPLDCAITALGGTHDERASATELAAWREQTRGAFAQAMFPGDHFYLASARSALLARLSADMVSDAR